MKYLYFKDPNPLGIATLSPDWWRDQYGTDGPDTLHGDWSKAPFFFASKADIGGLFIYAGGGEDTVFAGFGNDVVWGGSENDRLFGEGGTDTLYGEKGNDLLDGGQGADVMYGGNDNDTYVVDNSGDRVIEAVADGFDGVESHLSLYTLPPEVENLSLKGSAVEGRGNELDNHIFGNGEDNFISGWDGDDNLFGVVGDDWISGGNHNDTIMGGAGVDQLIGGAGADKFLWSSSSESGVFGRDVIWDFNPMQGDKIDLQALAVEAGVQNLSFIGANNGNTFTAPGQVSFQQDIFMSTFTIWANTDSDPLAEAAITVQNTGFTPDAGWFDL